MIINIHTKKIEMGQENTVQILASIKVTKISLAYLMILSEFCVKLNLNLRKK